MLCDEMEGCGMGQFDDVAFLVMTIIANDLKFLG